MGDATEVGGFEAVLLRSSGGLSATFVPAAGMVCASLRDGGEELLGQRRGLGAYASAGRTMGIPLLYPWANRLAGDDYDVDGVAVRLPADVGRDPNGLPIHGLLAGSARWRVEPVAGAPAGSDGADPVAVPPAVATADDHADRLAATLDFSAHPELDAAFPFRHRLRLDIALGGRTLSVRTTVTATGDRAVPLAFGFHPYLRLPGLPRSEWEVELPAMRRLTLDARSIPTGESSPVAAQRFALADRALDDGFVGVERGATFAVRGGGRRIEVRFDAGYPAAQVFAPPDDDVVCFEPMAAPANALRSGDGLRSVEPGASMTAAFSVTVAPG